MKVVAAPELQTTDWLNADEPVLLGALRGKVVLIEAFQMGVDLELTSRHIYK